MLLTEICQHAPAVRAEQTSEREVNSAAALPTSRVSFDYLFGFDGLRQRGGQAYSHSRVKTAPVGCMKDRRLAEFDHMDTEDSHRVGVVFLPETAGPRLTDTAHLWTPPLIAVAGRKATSTAKLWNAAPTHVGRHRHGDGLST